MAESTQQQPRKVVNLRLDPELHERLRVFAERTERSMNGSAVLAIRTFLDMQDAQGATAWTPDPPQTR